MTKEELAEYVGNLCKEKNYSAEDTKEVLDYLGAGETKIAKLLIPIIDLPLGRQSTFSRELNGLKDKHATLDTWHKGAKTAFDASNAKAAELETKLNNYVKQFGELKTDGQPPANQPAPHGRSFEDQQAERDQYYLRLTADLGRVRASHARMFKGEVIDDSELLLEIGRAASDQLNPRNISVDEAYRTKFGDRIKAEQERIDKDRDQKLIDQGAAAERKRMTAAGVRTGATVNEKSTLFTAIGTEGKKDDADRNRSTEESIALFEQDLDSEFTKMENATA